MTVSFRSPFIAFLSVIVAGLPGIVKAQRLDCDSLQHIINIVACDSMLSSLKGTAEDKDSGDKIYFSQVSLWTQLDDLRGQDVAYDKVRKGYSFRAYINNYSSSADELAATLKTFHDCLDKDWISRAVYLKSGDKITYFKNPVNYVVIAIKRLKERVLIECYNDSRNAAPECISGD